MSRADETHLEGLPGPVRRSGCYLVRIPIRWRDVTGSALAFHWYVEHRDEDGTWQRARRGR